MPAKYKGSFTEQQRQQSKGTHDYFRELHRDAYSGLRQMGRSTLTDKRADILLGRTADEIVGGLKVLVEIWSSAQEQVRRVVFEVSVVCSNCNGPPDETKDDPETGLPLPDPAHLAELDHLLDFANRSGRRRARSLRHKNSPGVPFSGHKKLMAALIKERRHFRRVVVASPAPIEFRVNGPECPVCHQPVKIIDDPMKN